MIFGVPKVKSKNHNVIASQNQLPPKGYSDGNYEMFYKNLNKNTDEAMLVYINKALKLDEVDLTVKFDLISV